MRNRKEGTKNWALVAISTFLSVVVLAGAAEAVLSFRYDQWRVSYEKHGDWYGGLTVASPNPILMWEYRPNAESQQKGLATIHTNQYGFRDRSDKTRHKQTGVYRIAFIGDSVTLGYKVGDQDTFVRKFEEYAQHSSSPAHIQPINFGIDGYNTKQIFELLRTKVFQFQPDKVVYVMCLNDFDFEESSGDKSLYFNKPHSFVLRRLEPFYRRLLLTDFHSWHYQKNKQAVFDTIVRMKHLLRTQQIPFQVVILPVFDSRGSRSFRMYPFSAMHTGIGQFLDRENIAFFDLLNAFQNQEQLPHQLSYDLWHPNEAGHDFIARQLLQPVLHDVS